VSSARSPVRHAWIDQARGIALIFLVIQHAGSYGSRHFVVPEWFAALQLAMAPFRMPLLMMVAGLLLERSLRKGAIPFIQSKLGQILWPFLVWTVISQVLAGDAGRLLEPKVWRGAGYLWFLPFLFAYFMVALLVRRIPHLVVAFVALVIAVLARDGSKHGEQLFVLMAYFFVGAYIGRDLERFTIWVNWRRILLLSPFVVGASAASVVTGAVRYNPLWFPVVVPASLCLFALLREIQHARLLRVAEFVGARSVVYYVANTPVYVAMVPWLAARGFSAHAIIGITLLIAFLVTTAMALAKDRRRAASMLFELPRSSLRAMNPLRRQHDLALTRDTGESGNHSRFCSQTEEHTRQQDPRCHARRRRSQRAGRAHGTCPGHLRLPGNAAAAGLSGQSGRAPLRPRRY
jgi:fucose 4-O-acetylase-like acetyltransferase